MSKNCLLVVNATAAVFPVFNNAEIEAWRQCVFECEASCTMVPPNEISFTFIVLTHCRNKNATIDEVQYHPFPQSNEVYEWKKKISEIQRAIHSGEYVESPVIPDEMVSFLQTLTKTYNTSADCVLYVDSIWEHTHKLAEDGYSILPATSNESILTNIEEEFNYEESETFIHRVINNVQTIDDSLIEDAARHFVPEIKPAEVVHSDSISTTSATSSVDFSGLSRSIFHTQSGSSSDSGLPWTDECKGAAKQNLFEITADLDVLGGNRSSINSNEGSTKSKTSSATFTTDPLQQRETMQLKYVCFTSTIREAIAHYINKHQGKKSRKQGVARASKLSKEINDSESIRTIARLLVDHFSRQEGTFINRHRGNLNPDSLDTYILNAIISKEKEEKVLFFILDRSVKLPESSTENALFAFRDRLVEAFEPIAE